MSNMTRHEKREIVFTLLFEAEFQPEKTAEEIYRTAVSQRGIPEDPYIETTFQGTRASAEALDEKIAAYARNWKVSRMTPVSRSILRLAVFEMSKTETPPRVAINEAVELAKAYDDGDGPAFINGVLNKLARENGYLQDMAPEAEPAAPEAAE